VTGNPRTPIVSRRGAGGSEASPIKPQSLVALLECRYLLALGFFNQPRGLPQATLYVLRGPVNLQNKIAFAF
jgi:hypothetical protein